MLDSDGATVLTTLNLGNVATPGSTSAHKLFVQNFGTSAATGVVVSINQVGTNDGSTYAQIAPDSGGSPGTFGTGNVTLGTINALATSPFWVEVVLPAGLTADANPRRFNLVATGLTS
jgi:hypothetical protein